jgi:hypothetical protein
VVRGAVRGPTHASPHRRVRAQADAFKALAEAVAAHVATRPFREPAQRYSVVAGGVGSIAGLSLADVHGIDHLTKAVIVALITGLPPWLWEVWWKQRRL